MEQETILNFIKSPFPDHDNLSECIDSRETSCDLCNKRVYFDIGFWTSSFENNTFDICNECWEIQNSNSNLQIFQKKKTFFKKILDCEKYKYYIDFEKYFIVSFNNKCIYCKNNTTDKFYHVQTRPCLYMVCIPCYEKYCNIGHPILCNYIKNDYEIMKNFVSNNYNFNIWNISTTDDIKIPPCCLSMIDIENINKYYCMIKFVWGYDSLNFGSFKNWIPIENDIEFPYFVDSHAKGMVIVDCSIKTNGRVAFVNYSDCDYTQGIFISIYPCNIEQYINLKNNWKNPVIPLDSPYHLFSPNELLEKLKDDRDADFYPDFLPFFNDAEMKRRYEWYYQYRFHPDLKQFCNNFHSFVFIDYMQRNNVNIFNKDAIENYNLFQICNFFQNSGLSTNIFETCLKYII